MACVRISALLALLLAALFVASSSAQSNSTTPTPPPSAPSGAPSGAIDPSAFAQLLQQLGVPPGTCEVYDPKQAQLSQCNRVVAWPMVYVFQGLNQTSLDFVAYNATFKSLYKQLALNCSTALMRLTCVELYLPCIVIPIPLGPPPIPAYNLSIPFSPCPDLCHDVYQYCGAELATEAGCSNATFAPPPPPSPPPSSSAPPPSAPPPGAGLPPGIPPEFLPILVQIESLPCATVPFNNTLFTRVCAPLTTDNWDDGDDQGPCVLQCPNPLFSYSERLGMSILLSTLGTFSIFYCLFSVCAILTHPVYRHFPKNAIGWLFCSLFLISWSDFIRLFYLGGNIDGLLCVHGNLADFTHASCGFQAVCLIIGLSGVLWWDVLVINLFLASYQLPRPEGIWNRVYHACCHLFIWPFTFTMIVLIASFGIVSDGIMTCSPDTSIWDGWMADVFFFIPFAIFMVFGFSLLTLVVLRILWVLRSKTLVKGASLRMVIYLAYGYLETTYFLTFHWENRIRQSAITATYTRYATCLASTLPWLRDSLCHIDGDHFHFSELIVAEILGSIAPWVAFYLLMTKYTMWAHWVWAFRVYILRQKELKMPFEESLRRKNVSRRMTRTGTNTGTGTASSSASGSSTQSSTGFTMDMPE